MTADTRVGGEWIRLGRKKLGPVAARKNEPRFRHRRQVRFCQLGHRRGESAPAWANLHDATEGGGESHFDLAATAILTLTLMFTSNTHRRVIIRAEGAALLAIHVAYISLRMF